MGKGGKKKAIPIYISIFVRRAVNKVLFKLPFNYKYIYNLKYMKICARHKLKQIPIFSDTLLDGNLPSCMTRPTLTFTGPHYELDLRAYAQ